MPPQPPSPPSLFILTTLLPSLRTHLYRTAIFRTSKRSKDKAKRGSSGNWLPDRVTHTERKVYAKQMGFGKDGGSA